MDVGFPEEGEPTAAVTLQFTLPLTPKKMQHRFQLMADEMADLRDERMTDSDRYDHRVTAHEPSWVVTSYRPDEDGVPEWEGDPTVGDSIDMLYDESEFECSCGADLDSWADVETHFEEVASDE